MIQFGVVQYLIRSSNIFDLNLGLYRYNATMIHSNIFDLNLGLYRYNATMIHLESFNT